MLVGGADEEEMKEGSRVMGEGETGRGGIEGGKVAGGPSSEGEGEDSDSSEDGKCCSYFCCLT